MKKIALFSDGTGNSASTPHKTNVWRAYQALDLSDGRKQIAYYDNGVGTSAFSLKAILGLAFGWGLARNVRQIYGFLCRTYDPGDEIYGFGFSRGAFTMRVAIALIASQGIVDRNIAKDDRDLEQRVNAAYRRFRRKHFTPSLLSWFLRPVRDGVIAVWNAVWGLESYDPKNNIRFADEDGDEPLIKFLGVWDTVDAYGFPVDELTRAWDMVVWPLSAKDRDLSPRIARACHALALDEQRESFEPMLWNEARMEPKARLEDERLSQVWFSGVHANVGGGYPDDGLAVVSLDWMIGESEKNQGLSYDSQERKRIKGQARIIGPLYDSRGGIGNLYRYAPRHIERLCKERKPGLANWLKEKLGLSKLHRATTPASAEKYIDRMGLRDIHRNEVTINKPKIHHTVFDRLKQDGSAYAPINLPGYYAYVDSKGNVVDIDRPGETAPPLPENAEQAKERRIHQSYVWNKVWGRRLLYFAALALIFCFIFYPYLVEPGGKGQEGWLADLLKPFLGTFGALFHQIPVLIGQIPGLGFAEAWAARYQSFPFVFTLGILFIGLLLASGWRVNRLLKSQMRLNWYHVTGTGGQPTVETGWLTKKLADFLEGDDYANKIAKPLRILLEAVAVLFLVLMLLAVGSRLFFVLTDAAGGICDASTQLDDSDFGKTFEFDPTDTCFNTGLSLQEGKSYQIDLEVANWKDKEIEADVKGWCQDWCEAPTPWYLSLFTPIRRHLLADWYQPIARIDDKLLDRYPLELKDAAPDREQTKLTAEITARRTGLLYLYLNDAVFFTPEVIKEFYGNNNGRARVTITESQ